MVRLLAEEGEVMPRGTETYEITISGLKQKRAELMQEMMQLNERMGVLTNDLEAIDHVLARFGHTQTELLEKVPHLVLFYRGQLHEFIVNELRERGPATTRQLCERLVKLEKKDKRDRRMMADLINRLSKALRRMQGRGLVVGERTQTMGQYLWRLTIELGGLRKFICTDILFAILLDIRKVKNNGKFQYA